MIVARVLFFLPAPPDEAERFVLAEELLPDRFPLVADFGPLAVDLELPVDFGPPLDLPDELDRDDVPELFPVEVRPPLDPAEDFAADDRPEVDLPLPEELERPPVLLPLDEDDDLDEPDERPPLEADFAPVLPPVDPDVDLRVPPGRLELLPRPPLADEEPDRPRGDVIVFAAAPTAPTAAPAAAPLRISPATSMTFSTIPDEVDFLERADPPRDDFDEDELLFFELLELVLVGTIFLPNERDKTLLLANSN